MHKSLGIVPSTTTEGIGIPGENIISKQRWTGMVLNKPSNAQVPRNHQKLGKRQGTDPSLKPQKEDDSAIQGSPGCYRKP